MPFEWTLPNNPIDTVALERMKQHFPKPDKLMPEAWFMGREINYYTWLAEMAPDALDARLLLEAMHEIAGGIIAFPKAVEVWQPWFRYLLPYALARAAERSTNWKSVLVEILTAFLSVYPQEIHEEYLGFRGDVVYSLGTRVYPDKLSPDRLDFDEVIHRIYAWSGDPPSLYDEFSLPMLYALKYLNPIEIETWVKSIIEIKNHAWRLGFIVWWLALDKFLQAASRWPQDGKLESLLGVESSFITTFWITNMSFASLDALIPHQNLITFQAEFVQHLTYDLFQSWVEDITSHRTLTDNSGPIPIDEPALEWIEQRLDTFRQRFFHNQQFLQTG